MTYSSRNIVLVCVFAWISACSQDGQTQPDSGVQDAGVDSGADASRECDFDAGSTAGNCDPGFTCSEYEKDGGVLGARCFEANCDLITQECGATQKCTFGESDAGVPVRGCFPAGAADEGQSCVLSSTNRDTCIGGLICATIPLPDGGVNLCLRFCRTHADCTPGTACLVNLNLEGSDERPRVCIPTCDFLTQNCPQGLGCYPGPGFVPGCYQAGSGNHGSPCTFANDCVAGALCVDNPGTCASICQLPSGPPSCASGTCTGVNELPSNVGVCGG